MDISAGLRRPLALTKITLAIEDTALLIAGRVLFCHL